MARDPKLQDFTDEEIARRRDELAKRMLNMPPQPLKPKTKLTAEARPPKKRIRRPSTSNSR
jgi:hypothetical protein